MAADASADGSDEMRPLTQLKKADSKEKAEKVFFYIQPRTN